MASTAGGVFYSCGTHIYRINAVSGVVEKDVDTGANVGYIAATGSTVAAQLGSTVDVFSSDLALSTSFDVGYTIYILTIAHGEIWSTASAGWAGGTQVFVDSFTGEHLSTISLPGNTYMLAGNQTYLYVVSAGHQLYEVNELTNSYVGSLTLPAPSWGIGVMGSTVAVDDFWGNMTTIFQSPPVGELAPSSVTAAASPNALKVTWSDSDSSVTSYTASAVSAGGTSVSSCSTSDGSTNTCTITGLPGNQPLTVTVVAHGPNGDSDPGTAGPFLASLPPSRISGVGLTAGVKGSLAVSWPPPASNGAAISAFIVSAAPGGGSCTTANHGCTITGLTDGQSYQVTVTATNVAGTSVASLPISGVAYQQTAITSQSHLYFVYKQRGTVNLATIGDPVAQVLNLNGTLPRGLSFTNEGGGNATISGTPLAVGSKSVTLSAKNGYGTTAAQTLIVTVEGAPVVPRKLTSFIAQVPGSATWSLNPTIPTKFTVTGLPSWAKFTQAASGIVTIAGTPPLGSGGIANLQITAPALGTGGQFTVQLTVLEAPRFSSPSSISITHGKAFTTTITTAGGWPRPPALTSGTLPRGLVFKDLKNGTGTLSGTVAAKGFYTMVISGATGGLVSKMVVNLVAS